MDDLETTGGRAAETAERAPSREETIVRDWFDRHIRNSPVSMSVEAFNHVSIVVEDLIEALKEG